MLVVLVFYAQLDKHNWNEEFNISLGLFRANIFSSVVIFCLLTLLNDKTKSREAKSFVFRNKASLL